MCVGALRACVRGREAWAFRVGWGARRSRVWRWWGCPPRAATRGRGWGRCPALCGRTPGHQELQRAEDGEGAVQHSPPCAPSPPPPCAPPCPCTARQGGGAIKATRVRRLVLLGVPVMVRLLRREPSTWGWVDGLPTRWVGGEGGGWKKRFKTKQQARGGQPAGLPNSCGKPIFTAWD